MADRTFRPFTKLNHRIRHLNTMIKIARNEAKAYRDEATYHQAVIDNIETRFGIKVEEGKSNGSK